MYYLLIKRHIGYGIQCEDPKALLPQECLTLLRERDISRSVLPLIFHIDAPCLCVDYLNVTNVPMGAVCSQAFIDVLNREAVPFSAYATQFLERKTEQPLNAQYYFWIPQWIEGMIDWERSEEWVNFEIGTRHLTKLVVNRECKTRVPLLFQTKERGYILIHEKLCERLEVAHLTGMAFVSLDTVYMPLEGLKRREIERKLQGNPDDWTLWCQLSTTFVSTHRYQDALESLNRVLMLKPDLEDAWKKRGHILLLLGDHNTALKALERAIELEPQSWAWNEYCRVLQALGRREEALTSAEHLVEIRSEIPSSWYELAIAHTFLGQNEKAAQAIEHCLVLGGLGGADYANIYQLKGEVLFKLGRYDEALAAYERGLRIGALHRSLWLGKINTLQMLGRNEEAIVAKQRLHDLDLRREQNLQKKPR